jgi:hypothetical protein
MGNLVMGNLVMDYGYRYGSSYGYGYGYSYSDKAVLCCLLYLCGFLDAQDSKLLSISSWVGLIHVVWVGEENTLGLRPAC